MEEKKSHLIPNSTQIPNVLLDQIIPLLPEIEARCLLYICRRTYGFRKAADRISLGQFERGIKTKAGEQLDWGAGVSRRAAAYALKNLKEAGLVFTRKSTKKGPGGVNYYQINLAINPPEIIERIKALRASQREGWGKGPRQTKLFSKGKLDSASGSTIPDSAGRSTNIGASRSTNDSAGRSTHKTKRNKEKLSNYAAQGATAKEPHPINDSIDRFKHVNPAWDRLFLNTNQRAAIERLHKRWGKEKTDWLIDILPQVINQRYAPRITTPIQLEAKTGDLIAYLRQQQNSGRGITITFDISKIA